MKFSLNLVENTTDISNLILKNLKEQLEQHISKAIPTISDNIKIIVKNSLISEPEYTSLKAGTLKAEFGIYNTDAVDLVIDAMVNTLDISQIPIKISPNGLSGGFILTMIKTDDINGIIYTDIASVIDNEKGYVLPWLQWLLLKGNDSIIQNYSVQYGSNPRSRSGMAIMIESDKNWRVPSNFVGTENDNWTTRAINKAHDKILQSIQSDLESYL